MDNIDSFLTTLVTQAELSRAAAEMPALSGGKDNYKDVPLIPDLIPSLLTRAKLSPETRRLEELRLKKLAKKKARLRGQGGKKGTPKNRAKGRYHWKRKEATKVRQRREKYESSAGFRAIVGRPYGCKRIDPELWEKYIGAVFKEYSKRYLTVKIIKRAPGFGPKAYYGNKEFPMTVYSFRVHHALLGVVWDGEEQRKKDGVEILQISIDKK